MQSGPPGVHRIGVISPQDKGLPAWPAVSEEPIPDLGVSPAELDRRMRANAYQWLPRQFDEEVGAFRGFYSARLRRFDAPQTVNLIAPWQLMAAFDRYQDEALLTMAQRAADWLYGHFVVTHPMSVALGGVRDTFRPKELWSKYTAEFAILNVGLYRRTRREEYLQRARQSGAFLIEAARHGFAPRYNRQVEAWEDRGWHCFGRAIEALAELEQATGEGVWQEYSDWWAERALSLQPEDGSFYLVNLEYYNSDLVADELRGLVFLARRTGRQVFMDSAQRFARWLLDQQRNDGAWPLTINRDGNVLSATVGPGDLPNIAVILLDLAHLTGQAMYRRAAMLAFRRGLGAQAIPGSIHPYQDDPRVQWGFWSWDPYYDYTLSADQSTHHVRGLMFLLDMEPHPPAKAPTGA